MNENSFEKDIQKLTVRKANSMIQKSKMNLSLFEQRIINYMIAKIKPDDKTLDYITIDYNEFCKICRVNYNTNFVYVKQIVKKLYDKSWELFDGKNYVPIKWLDDYIISEKAVKLKFHFRMQAFLIDVRKNFTETELFYYFQFQNKYSSVLYDYFFSYRNLTFKANNNKFEKTLTIDEFREKIGLDVPDKNGKLKYPFFKDLRVNVLEPCIDEINLITNLNVECNFIKKGRKIDSIKFIIALKDVSERIIL